VTELRPATAWRAGRLDARLGGAQLLFGWMYEDWSIEAAIFAPGSRVFSIASAGCTSLALAVGGMTVSAVDINPAQVAYVKARVAGAPATAGVVERRLARLRNVVHRLGPSAAEIAAFLSLADPEEQVRFFHRRLDRPLVRHALRLALHPRLLRLAYASPFVRALPADFARVLRSRLERGFATHPNATNPYAHRLLAGRDLPGGPAGRRTAAALTVTVGDAAEYLEAGPPARFDAFTLSNVLDGATPAYRERLLAAIEHAASPGAVAVVRSFAEPRDDDARRLAAADRALLWGSVEVHPFTRSA
jgi:S-adenosylmethionine:diacylglycerol 3-amino-3-carboxypropyl transferase